MVSLLLLGGAVAVAAEGERAGGTLMTGAGQPIGTVQLEQTAGGVTVAVTASGLTPGQHGVHLHAVGQCEGAAFASAGGHFNPTARKHGLKSADGAHAGDLPNLTAGDDGRAAFTATVAQVALTPGLTNLFDADGAALVIHARADDELTDPAGNSGDRVACAVLRPLAAGLPRAGAGGLATEPGPLLAGAALGLIGLALLRRRRPA
jgi:Cu-Zn family superoxide dismutase